MQILRIRQQNKAYVISQFFIIYEKTCIFLSVYTGFLLNFTTKRYCFIIFGCFFEYFNYFQNIFF